MALFRILLVGVVILAFFAFSTSKVWATPLNWTLSRPSAYESTFIKINPKNPNEVFASLRLPGDFDLLKSVNGGQAWQSARQALPAGADVNWISIPNTTQTIIAISLWGSGILTSSDGGESWSKIFNSSFPRSVEVDPTDINKIFVGIGGNNSGESGLYRSVTGGNLWTKASALGNRNNAQIHIDQNDPNRIFADADPYFFRSNDGGNTWTVLPLTNVFSIGTVIDKFDPNVIYTGGWSALAGPYKSIDNGDSWALKNNGFGIGYVFGFVWDDNGFLYVSRRGGTGGVWRSVDRSESWENISDPAWGNRNTWGLDVGGNRIFVGVEGLGIYYADLNTTPPVATNPVVFLPGLLGSWSYKGLVERQPTTPSDWTLTPIFTDDFYQPLLKTLENSGLVHNTDLFIFPYDWRQSISSSAVQLKVFLENTVIPQNPGKKINLVGHSMGGLVATYCFEKVPNCAGLIDKMVTGGSPFKGALAAYKLWAGGEIDEPNPVLRVVEEAALQLTGLPYLTKKDIVQNTMPGIRDILPVFDYIVGKPYLDMSASARNYLLESMSSPSIALQQQLVTFSGTDLPTDRSYNVTSPNAWEQRLGLWRDGKYVSRTTDNGDGTSLRLSSQISGSTDKDFSLAHTDYFRSEAGLQELLNTFGLTGTIETTISLTDRVLLFIIRSPAKITVFDKDGLPVGVNLSGQAVFIKNPTDQTYQIRLEGTGTGDYTLESYYGQGGSVVERKEIAGSISSGAVQEKHFRFLLNGDKVFQVTDVSDLLSAFTRFMSKVPGQRPKIIQKLVTERIRAITDKRSWGANVYALSYQQNELSWFLRQQSNPLDRQNLIQANYYFWEILDLFYHKYWENGRTFDYAKYQVDKADRYIANAQKINPIWNPVASNVSDAKIWQAKAHSLMNEGQYYKAEWVSRAILHLLPQP